LLFCFALFCLFSRSLLSLQEAGKHEDISPEVGREVMASLQRFSTSSKIKRTILTYLAMNMNQEKMGALRDIFVKVRGELY
jgi:hypothetical protein